MMFPRLLHVFFLAGVAASARSPTAQFPLEPNTILTPSKSLTLDSIPLLGFGTWNLDRENATEAVSWAIQAGYRHIDCDPAHKNQELVGIGIADGLNKTGLKREDLWITSKLQNGHRNTHKKISQDLATTLHDLQLSYLDLYHLSWPGSSSHKPTHNRFKKSNVLETWTFMTDLITQGLTHHIGVSNFPPIQLEALLNNTAHPPAAHQIDDLNPISPQTDWLAWHEAAGIHVTASAPLASSKNSPHYNSAANLLLETSVLAKIARERHCSSPAQVALAWALRRGTSVVPSSGHREGISEHFAALECELPEEDALKVDALGLVSQGA